MCEGIRVHAGGLLLLPAGGLVLGVCLNPGTGGLSATLSCELGMHILLLALGKWKVVWPMGAGETPAAPRDTLAMSCRHQWQGWGVPAGEELCSGSLHQPLSSLPAGLSLDMLRAFSVSRQCSAPAVRDQAPRLLSLWLSMPSASSAWLGSATTATILAPSWSESHGTQGAAPRVPTAVCPRGA